MKGGYYRNRGHLIKMLRKNEKLTQRELAEKLEISDSYISKYENGITSKNKKIEKKIYNFFKLSEDELVDYGNPKSIDELIDNLYYKRYEIIERTIVEESLVSIPNRLWRLSKNIIREDHEIILEDLKPLYSTLVKMDKKEILVFEYLVSKYKISISQNLEALEMINIIGKRKLENLKMNNLIKQLKIEVFLKLGIMFDISKDLFLLDETFIRDRNTKRYEENQLLLFDYAIKNYYYEKAISIVNDIPMAKEKKLFLYSKAIRDKSKRREILIRLSEFKEYKDYANLALCNLENDIKYLDLIKVEELKKEDNVYYYFLKFKLLDESEKLKNFLVNEATSISIEKEDYYSLMFYLNEYIRNMNKKPDYNRLRYLNKKVDKFNKLINTYKK